MKTTLELIEKYIDMHDDEREYVEKLTLEEQVLYKCLLRDSLSFIFFSLHELICEFVNTVIEDFLGLFDRKEKPKEVEESSVKPYIEEDTMCDKCRMLYHCVEEGLVVERTTTADMRRHYIPIPGGYCPGFVGDRKYAFRNKEVLDDDNNKQIKT